jgi:biotin carboxylase
LKVVGVFVQFHAYGFLSENSKFSKILQEHGIKFIGASPEMIDRMGDKLRLNRL